MLDLVCFGSVRWDTLALVPSFPGVNSGVEAIVSSNGPGGDATMVACHASQLGLRVGLVGNDIGNDTNGQLLLRMLNEHQILREIHQMTGPTPSNFVAVDKEGNRTWFGTHCQRVVSDCLSKSLSLFELARLAYIDGYLSEASARAVHYASTRKVPILLNMGRDRLVSKSSISITSYYEKSYAPLELALRRSRLSKDLAIVTLGEKGSIFATRARLLKAHTYDVDVVDASGAGAAFAAGVAYSFLKGFELEDIARFATALAGLHCGVLGGTGEFSVHDVQAFMDNPENRLGLEEVSADDVIPVPNSQR